ncbi:hypothetical protein QYF36_025680 [Acer negundo]|nr:hypothetical protein QYF36_025680 [Acer negundo]
MSDKNEDGRTIENLTPLRSRPINAAGPSETATPIPTPTMGVAGIPTPPCRRFRAGTGPPGVRTHRYESMIWSFQELRKEFMDFESRIQDHLEIVLDEIRDSNRRREEQHDEMMRIDGLTNSRGPGSSIDALTNSRGLRSSSDAPTNSRGLGSFSDGRTKCRGPGSFSGATKQCRGPGFFSGATKHSRGPGSSIDGPTDF